MARTDHVRADAGSMYATANTRHTASSLDDEYVTMMKEIKAEKKAKRKAKRAAAKRARERAARADELAASGVRGGLVAEFPDHGLEPPAAQTRDYVELPGGYGQGSSTLARWVLANMEEDAHVETIEAMDRLAEQVR